MARSGGLAAVVLGGAALAGYAAIRALSAERGATVVPMLRLARRGAAKQRAGLVPAAMGAPQGSLTVEPGAYPAVRRDESVVETLHGDTIADPYRCWGVGGGLHR